MTQLKLILLPIILILLISCKDEKRINSKIDIIDINIYLGTFDENTYYHQKWQLNFLGKDSVILISSDYNNSNSLIPCNNNQLYGKIIHSTLYDYEFIPSTSMSSTGCSKPISPYLNSDSAYIEFDSITFKSFYSGSLIIRSDLGYDTSFSIKKKINIFNTTLKNKLIDTSNFIIHCAPSKRSNIKSFTIIGGNNCRSYVSSYFSDYRYFISKAKSGYWLIIDESRRRNIKDEECSDCIDSIFMKIK